MQGLLGDDLLSKASIFGVKSGGLWLPDLSAYNTVADWGKSASVATNTWHTFLDITGEGYLTFVTAQNDWPFHCPNIRVTVDGTSYVFERNSSVGAYNNNFIVSPIYFKTSLKIEAYNSAANPGTIVCNITYLLKNTNPDSKKQTVLEQTNRKQAYSYTSSITYVDVVNISGRGYFLLALFSLSGTNRSLARFIIDGAVILADSYVTTYLNNLFLGPIRFNTSLQVQHQTNYSGAQALAIVQYTTD